MRIVYIIFLLLVVGLIAVYIRGALTRQEAFPEGSSSTAEDSPSLQNQCDTDGDCVWYEETQGDPVGRTHCSGVNYSKTCKSCRRLSEEVVKKLPRNFRCICNSNNRCQIDVRKTG
jgi:hypothetical protein